MKINTGSIAALGAALATLSAAGCGGETRPSIATPAMAFAATTAPIATSVNHVVVLYLENHSFDNLYGELPGVDGYAHAAKLNPQVDWSGNVLSALPPCMNTEANPVAVDPRFPASLPNAPFGIDPFVPVNQEIPDLVHRFYQEQWQIDGGKMDRFAVVSDAGGLSMGTYHTDQLPLAKEASSYTICDRFHHAAFGGSFLNHMWLIAAATPSFPNAPSAMVAQINSASLLVKDGAVTPDGFVVNTSFSVNAPHPASIAKENLVPNQEMPTIGDRLSDAGLSWAWYSGGWNDALAGNPDKNFQFHHQPFAYFKRWADGTQEKKDHLLDEQDFFAAVAKGTLPAVSFVKPIGNENEHPGYANVGSGESHAIAVINAIRNGPQWSDTLIVVTYDENGGFWDHVAPPVVDGWGPGTRVPAILISPLVKKGNVDHTVYDTTSILAFIERRWGLEPLSTRDAAANDFSGALER
jgi:phospholipase C